MTRKKHKKGHRDLRNTPLAKHTKVGSRLITPLSKLGRVTSVEWERDLLPEHLWLAALAEQFGLETAHRPYNALMNALDEFWTHGKSVCLGMLSDFAFVDTERRSAFLTQHAELVRDAFLEPIGRILGFYPDSPASWLIEVSWLEAGGPLKPETELARLRRIVSRLLPGKDDYAGRIRAMPPNRLFKHDRIRLASDLSVIDLLPRYPGGLNTDERFKVEALARSAVNMTLAERPDLAEHAWPKYFWRHNYDLVVCRPMSLQPAGKAVTEPGVREAIARRLVENAASAREYLDLAARTVKPDLYDPTRDEVLFGLFSRLTRLYALMCEEPPLWARDVAGIILRCLADTAIVFGYLIGRASEAEFRSFVEYGEGQEKLVMLHLQDNYPKEKSLEGQTADQLSEQLGRFPPELLDIELGHWTKKDQRGLARDAGLERCYRIVFAPTSSDVHGSWMSLKRTNLIHCGELLHRYHRFPSYVEPPFFVNVVDLATELYLECVQLAEREIRFPVMCQRPGMVRLLLAGAPNEMDNSASNS